MFFSWTATLGSRLPRASVTTPVTSRSLNWALHGASISSMIAKTRTTCLGISNFLCGTTSGRRALGVECVFRLLRYDAQHSIVQIRRHFVHIDGGWQIEPAEQRSCAEFAKVHILLVLFVFVTRF